jgi:hypothetical protein
VNEEAWQILVLLLLAAVVLEGLVLVGVMRQLGSLLLRLPPPRPGVTGGGPAPGSEVEVADLRAQAGVMVFLSPGCALCDDVVSGLPSLARHFPEVQLIAIPVKADPDARVAYGRTLPIRARPDLYDLRVSWGIDGTPYAVGFDRGLRVVGSGVVNGVEQVEALAVAASDGYQAPDDQGHVNGEPSTRVEKLEILQVAAGENVDPERGRSSEQG